MGTGIVDITGEEAVILDPLKVKAIAFSQRNEKAVIIEVDATVEAGVTAVENLTPAVISASTGQDFYSALNRRYFMKDGSVKFKACSRCQGIIGQSCYRNAAGTEA
jgi:hypothetical protein